MSEPGVLIVRRYVFGDHAAALAYGSTRLLADCGHDAWVAPSGVELIDERGVLTVCTDCAPSGPLQVFVPPGMREELAERVGVAEADQLIAEVVDVAQRDGFPKPR